MKLLSVLTASFVLSTTAFANTLPSIPTLTLELAEKVGKKAYEICKLDDVVTSVSVVDKQGSLLYFVRADGSGPHTATTSFRKAYTAASLNAPTGTYAAYVDAPEFSQLAKMADNILLLRGGLPITYKGALVGGIGLSGGLPEVEEECGNKAINSIFK